MHVYEPEQWMVVSAAGLLTMIINAYILTDELKKRIYGETTFTTKSLQLWSILSISCAVLVAFSTFIQYINGFCYFMWYLVITVNYSQPILANFYQLSRLYYCFARNQVYSNKGYPTYLFVIMFLIGIIILLSGMINTLFSIGIPLQCGINKHAQFYTNNKQLFPDLNSTHQSMRPRNMWFAGQTGVYFCWDMLTLLLYVIKLKTFKKFKTENITIYKRIVRIMYRVLILTLFYEMVGFIVIILGMLASIYIPPNYKDWMHVINQLSQLVISTLYTYSIYLMLEHNTSEYIKFLKFLNYVKLKYFCCCYHYVVVDQLEQLTVDNSKVESTNDESNATSTKYETEGISECVKIEQIGCELSVESTCPAAPAVQA
eukprot:323173_1